MQPVSTAFLSALKGSHRPWVRVDAWYDGDLVAADLPVAPGATVSFDASRTVQGQITGLQVVDPDGRLEPRSEAAALAPYGSLLHVTGGIEGVGDVLSLGWYRITRSATSTRWGWYDVPLRGKPGVERRWVKRGGTVDVDADDRCWQVEAERFLAPESPVNTSSCLAEIKRLLSGIMPLGAVDGITDRAVPSTVVYNDSRTEAIQALATAVGAELRVSPYGLLDLVPATPGPSRWTVAVASDPYTPGALVSADTVLSADDMPNAARSTGTDPATELPLHGLALETNGPLRFGGPHGRIPTFHESPLITTQQMVNADAATVLQTAQSRRAQTLEVVCVANPALQVLDTVTVTTPVGSVDGQVRAFTFPLSPGPMTMQVVVPRAAYLGLWGGVATA